MYLSSTVMPFKIHFIDDIRFYISECFLFYFYFRPFLILSSPSCKHGLKIPKQIFLNYSLLKQLGKTLEAVPLHLQQNTKFKNIL